MASAVSFTDLKELSRLDDPAVLKRCVKLKLRTALQGNLLAAAWVLFFAAFYLLMLGYAGMSSRSGRYHPAQPVLIPYGYAALGMFLAGVAGYFCIRNYYLLDPVAHRLYHQFQFLLWRRRRIVFRQEDILGLTSEGRMRRSKYGTYWLYRVVAVGKDGRQEPLTNWKRRALEECNAKARELAGQLGCASVGAPAECKVSVDTTGGAPIITFDSSQSRGALRWASVIVWLAILAIFMILRLARSHR